MSAIIARRRDSISAAAAPQSAAVTTSVQVAVRIRPVTSADQASIPSRWQRSIVHATASNSLQVDQGAVPPHALSSASSSRDKKQAFSFDRVLSPDDGQPQVYSVAEPLIARFLEGYNVTILAYGQTSSGKSYTMGTTAGDDIDYESLVAGRTADPQMGIIPRAVAQIFSTIKQRQARSGAVQYSAKASFIEIYNEDLIDLLADADGDARPHVQIREGKNGAIIWSGLREVKVSNVAEVMNYLLQGSSVRRTNETDMNAQSSRSHAIFSLTLTQRKYVGSGPPPPPAGAGAGGGRATSALGGRQSSGLPRPGSSILPPSSFDRSRVPSPSPAGAFGPRPHTPGSSGIPAPGAGGGRHSSIGLRPASMLAGGASARSASPMFSGGGGDDDGSSRGGAAASAGEGEWTTVTSKFHFVDLAGSERLKRTAAQGERAKEGISINSGLHALGNVISALGDPSKARRTTHVPYRDSKLTRLLQDSLGGNAHTLMIACVSPTEYNVSETVNTLQYANRARNIKNKAELNEVEVGWDDLDYLQTLVLRLRKELSILKGGLGGKGGSVGGLDGAADDGDAWSSARAAQREILEWQDKYASLSQKHSQLTAEVTKLRAQLDPTKHRESDADDYFKLAEPIIVEYEKSIDALEGQLNLTKAALAYVEDMANEQQAVIDDQSAKLQTVETEIEAKEMAIVELQTRLVKLQLRESSADTYAKELEGRLEGIATRSDTDAALVADLRKEAAKLRDGSRATERYVKELEARLASADESTAQLSVKVAQLTAESEQREAEYKNLAARFELLDSGDERKAMLTELDAREEKLAALQQRLDVVLGEKDIAAKQHSILLTASAEHEEEKDELTAKIHALEAAAAAAAAAVSNGGDQDGDKALGAGSTDSGEAKAEADEHSDEEGARLRQRLDELQAELSALRDSESQLRSDYESCNVKYREALREVEALNTQLTEAKLDGRLPRTSDLHFRLDGSGDEELEVLAPPSDNADHGNGSRSPMRNNVASRRSSMRRPESLLLDSSNSGGGDGNGHSRQNSASDRLIRRSSGSFLGYNRSDGTRTPGSSPHVRTRSMSQSLSQELLAGLSQQSPSPSQQQQQTRGPRPLSLTGSVPPSPTLRAFEPDSAVNYERKVASLEAETMRLQEALKERDDEIHSLEATLRELRTNNNSSGFNTAAAINSSSIASTDDEAGGKVSGVAVAGDGGDRSPTSEHGPYGTAPPTPLPIHDKDFEAFRQLLSEARVTDDDGGEPSDESILRLDDLMRAMARKETTHRESIEARDVEIDSLRKKTETLLQEHEEALSRKVEELQAAAASQAEEHKQALAQLCDQHAAEIQSVRETSEKGVASHAADLNDLSHEHAATVAKLDAERADLQKSLEMTLADAAAAEEHQRDELERVVQELQSILVDRDETKRAYDDLEARHREYVAKSDFDPHEMDQLRHDLAESSDALITLEAALTEAQEERDQLLIEIETVRQSAAEGSLAGQSGGHAGLAGLAMGAGANGNGFHDARSPAVDPALSRELEAHKTALSKTKSEMGKIKADLQAMMEERTKQEQTIKELQSRLASSETRSVRSQGSDSFGHHSNAESENAAHAAAAVSAMGANGSSSSLSSSRLSMGRRTSDYEGTSFEHRGARNSSVGKPPPPNPPPKMPPPPTPTGAGPNGSATNATGLVRSPVGIRGSVSSQMTRPDSPSGMTRSSSVASAHSSSLNNGFGGHAHGFVSTADGKFAKLLADQADEIKNLAKQLNHCEADLQANIDLVATLEAALNDSERNLRKSRVQLAEVTRERDRYSTQADEMRAQLNTAQHEVESVRNSVMLEKQGYESKIEEERQAKERARQALEARLEEVSKRKNSKLFCL